MWLPWAYGPVGLDTCSEYVHGGHYPCGHHSAHALAESDDCSGAHATGAF
jgi:hypothetical protein